MPSSFYRDPTLADLGLICGNVAAAAHAVREIVVPTLDQLAVHSALALTSTNIS